MTRADALVLDIGGDVGAVVVYIGPSSEGKELDLTPVGCPRSHDLHNVVRRRTTAAGHMVFAAVFPQVHEGSYWLWADAPGPIAELTVVGGQVCTVDVTEGEPTC